MDAHRPAQVRASVYRKTLPAYAEGVMQNVRLPVVWGRALIVFVIAPMEVRPF